MNRRRRLLLVMVVIVLVAGLAPDWFLRAADQGRAVPRTGITVFEDVDYGGRSRSFTSDQSSLRSTGLDDRISSLIVAQGEYWEACDEAGFRGRCEVFFGSEPDLSRTGWNDRISSLREVRRASGRGGPSALELFAGLNYTGQRVLITDDIADLGRTGFNDRAMSARVSPGDAWEICVSANYTDCRLLTESVPNLDTLGISRLASSVRQVRRPIVMGPQPIDLFAGLNYTGQRVRITDEVRDLGRVGFNDRAMSARVAPGDAWEICVNADYDDCRLLTESVPDLGALGIARLASSARPSVNRGGPGRGRGRGFDPPVRPRITLYERPAFGGRSISLDGDMESLGDFTDRAESVRVTAGRWQLCDRVRHTGRCVVVTDDVRDLDALGMRDRVASVRLLGVR